MRRAMSRGLLVVGVLTATACGSAGGVGTGRGATGDGVSSTIAVAAGRVQTGPVVTSASGADAWVAGTVSVTAAPCAGKDRTGRAATYPPTLLVIGAADGQLRWQFCPDSPTNGIGAAVAGSTVVFTTGVIRDDGQIDIGVAGFDAATGALRWQARRPGGVPMVLNDDLVAMPAASVDAPVGTATVDAATGTSRWQVAGVAVGAFGSAALGNADVVIGGGGDALVGLDVHDGSERWRVERLRPLAVTAGGIVGQSVSDTARQVAVVDAGTGKVRWTADGIAQAATARVVVVAATDASLPPATVPGTTGAPITLPNVTQVRDIADGRVLWTFDRSKIVAETHSFNGQAVPAARLILTTENMGVEVHDARTGDLLWSRPGPFGLTLADDDTMITGDGSAAVDTATGNERWRFTIPCISDRTDCTNSSSYVQNTAMHNGLLVLAVNDFGGG